MSKSLLSNYTKEELEKIVRSSFSYKEVLDKIGYATHNGRNTNTLKKYLNAYNISIEHFKYTPPIARNEQNVFCKNSTASQKVLRQWYIKGDYVEYKCAICGQSPIWNGQNLNLQLDHIDGDNKNNELTNLRWLCPNCHSQTDTFCGKGKKRTNVKKQENNKRYCVDCGKEINKHSIRCSDCAYLQSRKVERPSKEQLVQELRETNFKAVGRKYNVSDNTVRKWCKLYDISDKSKDYIL